MNGGMISRIRISWLLTSEVEDKREASSDAVEAVVDVDGKKWEPTAASPAKARVRARTEKRQMQAEPGQRSEKQSRRRCRLL